MSKLTEEELALLTEEERDGYLDDEDDDEGEEGNDDPQDDPTLAVDDPATAPPAANPQDGGEGSDQGDGAELEEQLMPQPKPLFNADLPADIEAQRTALDEKEIPSSLV